MKLATFALASAAMLLTAQSASAQAVREAGQFTTVLPANDDGSVANVAVGFNLNFFGVTFNSLAVNNNGNVSFDGPNPTFTPSQLINSTRQIIAPFFADVDTRNAGSNVVTYGQGTVDGRAAFGVNWIDVGYYNQQADKLNSFQLIIIDRSDIGAGDFDFEFNYDTINWETGSASGGTNGFGGTSAAVGFSNGVDTSFQLPGSFVNGALLDSNFQSGLIYNSLNSTVDGRYVFRARNGVIVTPGIPEASTWAMMIAGFGLVGATLRGRRRAAAFA